MKRYWRRSKKQVAFILSDPRAQLCLLGPRLATARVVVRFADTVPQLHSPMKQHGKAPGGRDQILLAVRAGQFDIGVPGALRRGAKSRGCRLSGGRLPFNQTARYPWRGVFGPGLTLKPQRSAAKDGLPRMARIDSIKKYPFGQPSDDNGYRLFPDEIEDDGLVFFHGTAEANLESIVNDGFKIEGALPSVSFGRTSALPLKYACEARSAASPNGCVIAVLFQSVKKPEITSEAFGLHVYRFDPQPEVIGYCIVPVDYVFR